MSKDVERYLQNLAIAQIRTETKRDILGIYLSGDRLHRINVGRSHDYQFLVIVAPTTNDLITGHHETTEHKYSFDVPSVSGQLNVKTQTLDTVALLQNMSKGFVDIVDALSKTPLYVNDRFSNIASSLYNRTSSAYQLINKTYLCNQLIERITYYWNLFQLREKSNDSTVLDLAWFAVTIQRYMRYVQNVKSTGSVTAWLNETSVPFKQELDVMTTAYKLTSLGTHDIKVTSFIDEIRTFLSSLNEQAQSLYEWNAETYDLSKNLLTSNSNFEKWIILK